MEKLFLNFCDFMYGHNWIAILIVAVAVCIFWWKVGGTLTGSLLIGWLSVYAITNFGAGEATTAFILALIYTSGFCMFMVACMVIVLGLPIGGGILLEKIQTTIYRRREERERRKLAKAVVVVGRTRDGPFITG